MEIISLTAVLLHILASYIQLRKRRASKKGENTIIIEGSLNLAMLFKDYIIKSLAVITLIIYLIDYNNFLLMRVNVVNWIKYIGVIIVYSSIILKIFAYKKLGENWSDRVAIYNKHSLVNTGVYNQTRNPIYTSYAMLTLGGFMMTGSYILLLLGGLYFVIDIARSKKEEKELERKFGEEYMEYKNTTGAFVPININISLVFLILLCNIFGMADEVLYLSTGNSIGIYLIKLFLPT
ncbi:isoprenylcysteine carboxylmethyltransferase family protein [Candidatus Parcubacteria bacterium]|nr:isoprenylcysteine carboxylmethyltransferase family protein [Patescibacteria group bacterium]MBU4309676.1 isoprenylcysteine carboxylmethyltransferase family protein [Patescibacteria group bacterium]MBU4432000.1 isoprenylcysteine carboxylmethyltransferase family protein [Patescibacteria group bacterium]MBU4577936.1 isoprenylcysteine carboxylmethyltransferase family protein [Patescibacteria group bacterium]MCG2696555.1 isoprenylcysteine carboxylmethyltransferase family protein [Candidatus Parcu